MKVLPLDPAIQPGWTTRSPATVVGVLIVLLAGLRPAELRGQDPARMPAVTGPITSVVHYELPDSPEGIAFGPDGLMYVGVRNGSTSRIERISADGSRSVHSVLPDQVPGSAGVLGLAVGPDGVLYAAHATGDPSTRGVYRIDAKGAAERVEGSDGTIFPNALTFDSRGNLYVTDSFGPASIFEPGGGCSESARCGMVWRIEPGGSCRPWLRHSLFDSAEMTGAPIPVPGPNGLAYFASSDSSASIFVANTSMGAIMRIRLDRDGFPGPVEIFAEGVDLMTLDGIAVDANGRLYAAMAASGAEETGAPPVPALTVVHTDGSSEALVPFDVQTPFDAATSLAFGGDPWHRTSLYVVNSALYGPLPNNPGPGIVEVPVGATGVQSR